MGSLARACDVLQGGVGLSLMREWSCRVWNMSTALLSHALLNEHLTESLIGGEHLGTHRHLHDWVYVQRRFKVHVHIKAIIVYIGAGLIGEVHDSTITHGGM